MRPAALLALWIAALGCDGPLTVVGGTGGGGGSAQADAGLRTFLTSTKYDGNLKVAANVPSSGLAGANLLCARHASDAGLGGQWVAFVGTSLNPPASRVPGTGPWSKQLPDGGQTVVLVGLGLALMQSVDFDEKGRTLTAEVWSGRAGPSCSDWHSDAGEGSVASPTPASGKDWQNTGTRACNLKLSLLCLEL